MSRIGKKEIVVASNIKVDIKDNVSVSNGKHSVEIAIPKNIKVTMTDNIINVSRANDESEIKSLHGLTRNLISNAVDGFVKAFEKVLVIKGVGYKANVSEKKIVLNVGFSHSVELVIPEHIDVKADGKGVELVVSGVDKMKVGEFAAEIRKVRPPEPYKGTGIMYKGEKIVRKAGKSAGK